MIAFNEILDKLSFSSLDFQPGSQEIVSTEATSPDSKKCPLSGQFEKSLNLNEESNFLELKEKKQGDQVSNICRIEGKKFKKSLSNPITITVKEFKLDGKGKE